MRINKTTKTEEKENNDFTFHSKSDLTKKINK